MVFQVPVQSFTLSPQLLHYLPVQVQDKAPQSQKQGHRYGVNGGYVRKSQFHGVLSFHNRAIW